MKYNTFDKDQNKTYTNKFRFHVDRRFYDKQEDVYICPMGQQ